MINWWFIGIYLAEIECGGVIAGRMAGIIQELFDRSVITVLIVVFQNEPFYFDLTSLRRND